MLKIGTPTTFVFLRNSYFYIVLCVACYFPLGLTDNDQRSGLGDLRKSVDAVVIHGRFA